MIEDITDSIVSKMREWKYNDEDITEAADIFETYAESNGEILEYIITDASESAPNRYDDCALDVMCLTQTNIFFVVYNSELSRYSSRSIDAINGLQIETTSQRIELTITFQTEKYGAASYNEERFEDIRDFGLSVDSKMKE